MKVLGIETSCDETGLAIYDTQEGLLGQVLYSQVKLHQDYGGVVPEIASRDHVRKIVPLLEELLGSCSLTINQLDGIAYTKGPGLIGALLVGSCFAKSLGFALGVPTLGIHHLEGHMLAAVLDDPRGNYQFLSLLISGGHTMLLSAQDLGKYKILGETLDDAVGEAFDKTAKVLGLGYPGGPALASLAETGDPTRFNFPRPMVNRPGLDFSFSGLKTFALNTYLEHADASGNLDLQTKADIARAFQDAVIDTLVIKLRRAVEQTGLSRVVVAGGVGANTNLRSKLMQLGQKLGIEIQYPKIDLCTDNGAMIAFAGHQRLLAGERDNHLDMSALSRWDLEQLSGVSK